VASRIYSVVAVVTNDQGHYLAVSRKDDHDDLGFPGGKIEPGESPEEAVVRELYEETGLLVSRRALRSTFIAPDEQGRLCMAFDVMQHRGVAYSREGAWVGWVEPARFLTEGSTYRDYFLAFFEHKGIPVDLTAIVEPARVEPAIVAPAPSTPPVDVDLRRPPPRRARRDLSIEDSLQELTGVTGFPQHHITFLYGPAALAFCPTFSLPQPRVTFDQKYFAGLLSEPVLGIRTHQQKSLVPLNLLRYMHSLGPRCVSAVVAVSPHRPPEDWEAVASNIIECEALQVDAKLTLKKSLAATKPVGTSVVAPMPAGAGATTVLHQPRP
jgi:8-oxo-dGTP diphosphatase